jgi:hypothetical protein
MSAWRSVLERLPRRARRVAVWVSGLVVVGLVVVGLTMGLSRAGGRRPSGGTRRAQRDRTSTRIEQQRVALPVSAARLFGAHEAAKRFLGNYLPFAYGRAGVLAGRATPALRHQLIGERALITPVERRRHPRVVSLQVLATTPGFVVATAVVEDGGATASRLWFTLQAEAGRWVVSSVGEG